MVFFPGFVILLWLALTVITMDLMCFPWVLLVKLVPNTIGVVLVCAATHIIILYFSDTYLSHCHIESIVHGRSSQQVLIKLL